MPQHLSNSQAQIKLGRMRMMGLFAVLLLACVSTARAASFDCAKASSAVEKTICADPALSKADDRMAEVFAAASGATMRPGALRADQLRWLGERNKLTDPAALQKSYQQRIEELITTAKEWQATAVAITAAQARQDCLVPPDAPHDARCRVDEFGDVRDDPSLRYQLQSYKDGELRVAGGVAVFKTAGPTLVPIVAVAIDTAHFAPPQVVQSPAGRLLVVRGHIEGTGNFNADQVYLYGDSRLIEVDTTSWLNELPPWLPKGWGAWKGIYPDYASLVAKTPLWQEGDGNCCPTAGRAVIQLGLQNYRLMIKDVKVFRGRHEAER